MSEIDLAYLKEISGGSDEFVKQMITLFLEQTPGALANLEKHYNEKNWIQLRAAVHQMKPSISFMGISAIEEDVNRLEQFAETQTNTEQMSALISRISETCGRAMEELKQELENQK